MQHRYTPRTNLPPGHVRMTLRVSRDSGETWGPVTTITEDAPLAPISNPIQYPPCECSRCREQGTR
ncbi:hypothetical protein DBP18_17340 [Streptomyces sp. CS081A]|nr:hypothetical protein DBP18_17340 [Streptomyces sp. CS081A]